MDNEDTLFALHEKEAFQDAQKEVQHTKKEIPKSDRELRSEVRKLRTGKIIPAQTGRGLGLLSMDFLSQNQTV